jgi:hypothetical protein
MLGLMHRKLGAEMGDIAPAYGARKHDPGWAGGHDRGEVAVDQSGTERIHAHHEKQLIPPPSKGSQERGGNGSRALFGGE